MNVKMMEITPADAERMLMLNDGNRPFNKHHVSVLAREMKTGRWKVNGDTICLSGTRLIDGQHRLMAVIESGCTIQTLVVDGVAADVFDTKDVGRRRSAADTLAIRGESNTANLAAALAVIDRYMTSRLTVTVRYTNTEIEELLEKYPDVRGSITKGAYTKKLVPNSILTACHYLFAKKDSSLADQFVENLIDGNNLTEGSPVYILRERLLANALSKAKLPATYIMALIIKAWNATRSGSKIRLLKFLQDEDFPVVQ